MDYIKKESILGGPKVIVGDKSSNLVLANAGSVYILYGGSYKKLQDLINELVAQGVLEGIDKYKQEVSELKKEEEQKLTEQETSQNVEESDTEELDEEFSNEEISRDEFDLTALKMDYAIRWLILFGLLPSNFDSDEPLEDMEGGEGYGLSPVQMLEGMELGDYYLYPDQGRPDKWHGYTITYTNRGNGCYLGVLPNIGVYPNADDNLLVPENND